jgi:hypothetical protein
MSTYREVRAFCEEYRKKVNANLNSNRTNPRTERSLRIAATLAVAVVAGAFHFGMLSPGATRSDRMGRVPRVVLWAWERREDLSFIDPRQIAVAYLDRTLELSAGTVVVRPRLEPLTVPPRTVLIPVARIEIDWRSPPSLSAALRSEVSRVIAAMAAASPPAIQIDFDATRSQRAFYRDLIADVRGRLPASTALSITALASWCMYDDWVAQLPVDEIVPMLYRMGPDAEEITSYLRGGGDFAPPLARISVGLSTDEHLAGLADGKRAYLFSPHAWTLEEARQAIAEVTK